MSMWTGHDDGYHPDAPWERDHSGMPKDRCVGCGSLIAGRKMQICRICQDSVCPECFGNGLKSMCNQCFDEDQLAWESLDWV